jgi:hypothetical protein
MRILVRCSPGTLDGEIRQKKKSPLPSNGIIRPFIKPLNIFESLTAAIRLYNLLRDPEIEMFHLRATIPSLSVIADLALEPVRP